jgi:hypothetical protein
MESPQVLCARIQLLVGPSWDLHDSCVDLGKVLVGPCLCALARAWSIRRSGKERESLAA